MKTIIDESKSLINTVFTMITLVVMVICFFSLTSSMSANIIEQTKEIAVLRTLGLRRGAIVRLYVSEAFTLVFSSSMIGLLIGVVIGYMMAQQRAFFTQVSIPVEFPMQIFIFMVASSVICAVISALWPSRSIAKHSISDIVRFVQ